MCWRWGLWLEGGSFFYSCKALIFSLVSAKSTPWAVMHESAPDRSNKKRKLYTMHMLVLSAVFSVTFSPSCWKSKVPPWYIIFVGIYEPWKTKLFCCLSFFWSVCFICVTGSLNPRPLFFNWVTHLSEISILFLEREM